MRSRTIHGARGRLLLAGLVASSIALGLTGCGGSTPTATGTATGAPAAGKTEITLSMQNPDVKTADPATWSIIQAFEAANPNIKVTVSGEAVAEHLQKLSIAAQSDTLPDIFWIYKANAEEMQQAGKLLDLKPLLDEVGVTKNLPASTVANFTANGSMYGVPYQQLLTGLWVNNKVLQDNGLTMPKTFEELVTVAKALHSKGITTISNGANQSSFSVWSFLVWLDRFGYEDKVAGLLDGSVKYNNPDFLRMYEHIAELRDAGAFPSNVSTQTYQQAVSQFTSGKAAMLDAGVWASSAIQGSEVAPNIGFWQGPQFSDGVGNQNIFMNVASAPLVVTKKVSSNPGKLDAVKKFLAFYYGDKGQQFLVDNGQPPVTTYQPQVDATKQGVLKVALAASTAAGVSSPKSQPDLLVPTQVANAMYDSIYGVIQNQLTPAAALDLVQKALDANR